MFRSFLRPTGLLALAALTPIVFVLGLGALAPHVQYTSAAPSVQALDRARLRSLAPSAMPCVAQLMPLAHHLRTLDPLLAAGLRPSHLDETTLYGEARTMRDSCWSAATRTLALRFSPGRVHDPARRSVRAFYGLMVHAAMGAESAASAAADLALDRLDLARHDLADAQLHITNAGRDDASLLLVFAP
jgi:hypothetical protein